MTGPTEPEPHTTDPSVPSGRAQPVLSVVLTTWNRADEVGRAVRSAVAATEGLDREVVVVDDGSTDDTASVLATLVDDVVRVVRQDNSGLAAARNRGVREARGEWLAFLDDDDELLASWAAAFTPFLADPGVGIVSGAAELVDGGRRPTGVDPPVDLGPVFAGATAQFFAGCFAVRRSVYDAAGGYLDGLPCSHQTELCIRLSVCSAEAGLRIESVSQPVARIERRATGDRALQRPELLLDGCRWVLERHPQHFALDPAERQSWEQVAAVAAARIRRWDVARRYGWRAVRTRPSNGRAWARAGLLSCPPVAARVWRPGRSADGGSEADRHPLRNAALVTATRPPPDRYFLPWRYRENEPASADRDGRAFWEEGLDHNDVRYQDAVYRWAARIAAAGRPVVLDVGCGSGDKLVDRVAPRAGTTIGVDQPSGIRLAEERFPDHRWLARDLEDEATWDELAGLRPDLVLCSDVVEHVEDPALLLRRLAAVAGSAGLLLLSTPDRSRLDRGDPAGPPHNPRHVREWSDDGLELLVESVGLQVVERRHFLPRRYSFDRTDLNRTVYRALHRAAVPDRRSSFALLLWCGGG